jgi:anti-sigma factor RsiW
VTSTTDTAGHPEVAEISDLTEGLLPPTRTADVRRHLDECPLCADVHASLEEIRGLLGTLPGPGRMPDDVAGRIHAALAAEALLESAAPDSAPPDVPTDSETKDAPATLSSSRLASTADDSMHVSRETSPAAERPAGHSRASTGPGRTHQKRRNRRRAVLGAVFAVATLGLSALMVQSMNDDSSGNDHTTAGQSAASDSFSGVKLEKQVENLLDGSQSQTSPGQDSLGVKGTPESQEKGPNSVLKTVVPDCIAKGIGDTTGAIASKSGTYRGAEAHLVLLPDRSDDTRVTVYIVDASCLDKASEPAGEVLLKRSYASR